MDKWLTNIQKFVSYFESGLNQSDESFIEWTHWTANYYYFQWHLSWSEASFV